MASFNRKVSKTIGSVQSIGNGLQSVSTMKELDLKIYENPDSKCRPSPDNNPITERCSALKRLCTASLYFDNMNSSKLEDAMKQNLWVEFNEEVYQIVIEDTIHLIQKHDGDIQQIQTEWTELYGLPKCTVSECAKMARHYDRERRNRNRVGNIGADDTLYAFYQSLHDRVHHFLFHLYDIGMRVEAHSMDNSGKDEKEHHVFLDGVVVDKWFAVERDLIAKRKKELNMGSERMDPVNNKYTMQMVSENDGGITLMDALFQKLSENTKIQIEALRRIRNYFEGNEIDSECIEMDIEDVIDSNISNFVDNEATVQTMADFIQSTNLRRGAFSTGFVFQYGDCYATSWVDEDGMNVVPIHQTLKEEILEGGHLTAAEWLEFVDLKTKKYMKTQKVKKMKSNPRRKKVKKEHIHAIILYCDFSNLCTAFSATFRRKNVFETMDSVKQRHSHFAIFGRLLVELVLEFGMNVPLNKADAKGPFFCGLNCILNVGSFAITLRGPCSTSIHREVAVNFAKENGIILKLDNDTRDGSFQLYFDCSWISNYFEESERLWIAGKFPLRIVSIVMIQSAKNYRKMLRALFLFDAMISGVSLFKCKIRPQAEDYKLLQRLIDSELCEDAHATTNPEFDEYLKKEWALLLQSKEEIELRWNYVQKDYRIFSDLVVNDLVKYEENEAVKGNDNILKAQWIFIFPKVHTVKLLTYGDKGCYKFRLEALLDSMKAFPHSVGNLTVIDAKVWGKESLTEDIKTLFAESGWAAEYKEDKRRSKKGKSIGDLVFTMKSA